METKHHHILKKLFWTFEDNIRDSKYFVEYAEECKEHSNMDMANYFLNEAKTRIDKNETVKNKIDNIVKMSDTEESPYKVLYDWKIEEYKHLRDKIMKISM